MAERRMFSKKVMDSDKFLSLPSSAQALYLHISMGADDDGFSNQTTMAMFKAHADASDLELLIENGFIIRFDDGVVAVKHWRVSNQIRADRHTKTLFKEHMDSLEIQESGEYDRLSDGCQVVANGLPDGCQVFVERLPQYSIGKDSIVEDSIVQESEDKDSVVEDRLGSSLPKREEPITIHTVNTECNDGFMYLDMSDEDERILLQEIARREKYRQFG